jgi:pyruvate dehydrogenase E2 component (dihydrolipoamide acetyltransferase)
MSTKIDNVYTIIETFVGCGGSHLGFKANGFKTVFCNDIWQESLNTLKKNNDELEDTQIICEDINELVKRNLLEEYNLNVGDLSVLMELRAKLNKKHKTKISPLAFISKITATLLYEFPLLNSSLDHNLDNIIVKKYVNLGIAVDTPEGLIVPNIKNIENKSISVISEEIKLLAESAKTRKLKLSDLKGASFTISSLGAIGGKFFTPIINPPEVAILGLSKTFQKIIPESKSFKTRDFLPLSLSYDHRVINGVYAVQFTTQLGEALSDVKLIEKSFK